MGEDLWDLMEVEVTENFQVQILKIKTNQIECTNEVLYFKTNNSVAQWKGKILDLFNINDFTTFDYEILLCESEGLVYELCEQIFRPTNCKNIYEYYLNKYQSTFRTIRLNEEIDDRQQIKKDLYKSYLIKLIKENEIDYKELSRLSKLSSYFIAKITDIEFDRFSVDIELVLIRQTLECVIQNKPKYFGRNSSQKMNLEEFFI